MHNSKVPFSLLTYAVSFCRSTILGAVQMVITIGIIKVDRKVLQIMDITIRKIGRKPENGCLYDECPKASEGFSGNSCEK